MQKNNITVGARVNYHKGYIYRPAIVLHTMTVEDEEHKGIVSKSLQDADWASLCG